MIIRKFQSKDVHKVCELVSRTFKEFVAKDCTKKGIKKLLEEQKPEKQIARSKTRYIYVAVMNNKIDEKDSLK